MSRTVRHRKARRNDGDVLQQREMELEARVALALSIVQHRTFCADCRPHTSQIRLALIGASIDEIMVAAGE